MLNADAQMSIMKAANIKYFNYIFLCSYFILLSVPFELMIDQFYHNTSGAQAQLIYGYLLFKYPWSIEIDIQHNNQASPCGRSFTKIAKESRQDLCITFKTILASKGTIFSI